MQQVPRLKEAGEFLHNKVKLIEKLLYKSNKDIEAKFIIRNETLWSSQKSHSRNIWNNIHNISMYFANIIPKGELDEKEVRISSKDLLKTILILLRNP